MSQKVHSQGNVPFSWENKPGISKAVTVYKDNRPPEVGHVVVAQKLPPPPCPPESARASFHDLQVPLPPCGFQPPPTRSSSKKGLIRKQLVDDPFLNAYRECTKSTRKGNHHGFGLKKNMSLLSCKNSTSVRDDNMVRISKIPR